MHREEEERGDVDNETLSHFIFIQSSSLLLSDYPETGVDSLFTRGARFHKSFIN